MATYTVVIEQAEDGSWGAYAPDLPGLGIGAATKEDAERLIREGITHHIAEMRARGMEVPAPTSVAFTVEVAA